MTQEPPIPLEFFATAAQVIPVLLVLVTVEERTRWGETRKALPLAFRAALIISAFMGEGTALQALSKGADPTFYDLLPDLAGMTSVPIIAMIALLVWQLMWAESWRAPAEAMLYVALLSGAGILALVGWLLWANSGQGWFMIGGLLAAAAVVSVSTFWLRAALAASRSSQQEEAQLAEPDEKWRDGINYL